MSSGNSKKAESFLHQKNERKLSRKSAEQRKSNKYFIYNFKFNFTSTLSVKNHSLTITGDYRRLSFKILLSKASLLGYDLTILYNPSLSELFLGPSFFPLPVDIQIIFFQQNRTYITTRRQPRRKVYKDKRPHDTFTCLLYTSPSPRD